MRRGERQAARPGAGRPRGASRRSSRTASCSSTRSTRSPRRSEVRGGGDVSREGVQRDLLPLIEGTTVTTKHGPVKTDHVLFIASRRLPPRQAVGPAARAAGPPADPGRAGSRSTRTTSRRILTEPEASLVKQYKALLATEKVDARLQPTTRSTSSPSSPAEINEPVENIGARRLQTVMEKLLEEISFTASDRPGTEGRDRRGLCPRAGRRAGQERRSEQVRAVALIRHLRDPR